MALAVNTALPKRFSPTELKALTRPVLTAVAKGRFALTQPAAKAQPARASRAASRRGG
jgi:hypothetical protein